MTTPKEVILDLATPKAWHAWLKKHHTQDAAILLRIVKGKGSSMSYAESLDVALAWGWIDSQKRALDEKSWLQRYGRRTAKSPWSKINCKKADALVIAGKMEAPGLAEVERAKMDGRWERAYDGARSSKVPDDLAAAFSKNARAKKFFEALDGANRYAILYRVQTAKKPETRGDRIARFVGMCAKGETLHPTRKK